MGNFSLGSTIAAYPGRPLRIASYPYNGRIRERVVFGNDISMPKDELWAWEIVGENPRRTVWFAEPMEKICDKQRVSLIMQLSEIDETLRGLLSESSVECVAPKQSFSDKATWTFERASVWQEIQRRKQVVLDDLLSPVAGILSRDGDYILVITKDGRSLCEYSSDLPSKSQLDAISSYHPSISVFYTERLRGGGSGMSDGIGGPHGTDFEGREW